MSATGRTLDGACGVRCSTRLYALRAVIAAELGRARIAPWLLRAAVLSAAVCALCLRSLAGRGYLVQVDATFGPQRPAPSWGFGAPVTLLEDLTSLVVGTATTGRLYVLAALFLCCFMPMFLLRDRPWYAQVAAGLLGALNPWVYARIVEGQWGVVVAAAGLFLWIAAWEQLQERPGPRSALGVAAVTAADAAFSETFLPVIAVAAVIAVLCAPRWRSRLHLRWLGATLLATVGFLLYGVVPFLLGQGTRSYAAVERITGADFRTFSATSDGSYGLIPNLVGLHGYWGERTGRFPLLNGGEGWWVLTTGVLAVLACAGALACRRRAWLLAAGVAGIVVSASTATDAGASAATWLAARAPIAGALREPQKFDALWLVALAVLGAEAVAWAGARSSTALRAGRAHGGVLAATTMVLATLLPSGAVAAARITDTVGPVRYPADWYAGLAYIESRVPADSQMIVLPWHEYETLPFAGGRLVSNPAGAFFPRRLLLPDDLEISGRVTEAGADPLAELARAPELGGCALARALGARDIHWAIVEDAPGGESAAAALQSCGFRVVAGSPGSLRVLQGEQG